LFIDSSGRLGIANSSPSQALDVAGNAILSGDNRTLQISNGQAATINFAGAVTSSSLAHNSSAFQLITTQSNGITFATGGSERMRLDSSGRLGLGTSGPQALLHLNGAFGSSTTANALTIRNASASSASNIAQADFWCSNTFGGNEAVAAIQGLNPNASANNGGAIAFAVSSNGTATTPTERMRLTPTGLGIGITTPQSPLHVVGSSVTLEPANPGNVLIKPAKAGGAILIRQDENTTDRYLALGQVDNLGAFYEFSRLDNSGRLLVGTSTTTSSSTAVLQGFNGVSTNPAILRLNVGVTAPANNDALGYLTFGNADHYSNGQIAAFRDGGTWTNGTSMPTRLMFSTTADGSASPTERMRITSAGNVGIGSNLPQHRLQVSGGSLCVDGFSDSANAYISLREGYSPSAAGGIGFRAIDHSGANADGLGCYGADGISFYTFATERARIDSSGRLGLGTSAPNYQLHVTTDFAVGASGFNQQLTFSNDTIQSLLLGTGYTPLKLNPLGGNVGIGVTTVGSPLHVKANSTEGIRIESPDYSSIYGLVTSRRNSNTPLEISAVQTVGTLDASISFSRSTNGTTFAESGRWDKDGRLLVGTSTALTGADGPYGSQYSKLVAIGNTTGSAVGICSFGYNGVGTGLASGTSIAALNFTDNAAGQFASIVCETDSVTSANDYPGRLVFSTTADGASSPTERLRIDSSGRVGLGSSNPGARAEIRQDSASAVELVRLINDDTSGAGSRIKFRNYYDSALISSTSTPGLSFGGSLRFQTYNDTNTLNTGLVMDNQGRVGIGTTSPGNALHVVGNIQVGSTSDTIYSSNFGNYSSASDLSLISGSASLLFKTGAANDERARIDTSGRLLVGTSSARSNFFNTTADSYLQLEGAGGARRVSIISCEGSSDTGGTLVLAHQRSGSVGGNTIVQSGDIVGRLSYQGNDGVEFVEAASINCEIDGTPGTNDMPGRLVFSTTADGASSPTERMRITKDGQLLVGTTSNLSADNIAHFRKDVAAGIAFVVSNEAGSTAQTYRSKMAAGANNTSSYHFVGTSGELAAVGTDTVFIFGNGNIQNTNNSYGAISDIKLKENIVDAGSQWNDLKALQVRKYNLKEGQTHTQIGLVAQEVELVSPGLVNESPDRDEEGNDLGTVTKSVNYSVLYMKAVKALQEAMERIETLEADVAALKAS
jgi:hypothetical protein